MDDTVQPTVLAPIRTSDGMSWKSFTIRLIEAMRWPLAFVVILFILREPITRLIDAVGASISR